jgi:hypothetical protein
MAARVPSEGRIIQATENRIDVEVSHDYTATRKSITQAANVTMREHPGVTGTWMRRVERQTQIDPGEPRRGVEMLTLLSYTKTRKSKATL